MRSILTLIPLLLLVACESNDRRDHASYQSSRDRNSDYSSETSNPQRDQDHMRIHERDDTVRSDVAYADEGFIRDAAMANLTEIELGRLAQRKARNADVRRFGQRMIDDHGKAQSELQSVARSIGVDVPQTLDSTHRDMVNQLERESDMNFDREFMRMMVEDHGKVVDKFDTQSRSARNTQVRDFATRTLPTLRDHLREAREIRDRIR